MRRFVQRWWLRARGHSCYTCEFARAVRSVGDGQVSRLIVTCQNPASPHYGSLIPQERWCDHWQRATDGRRLPRMEDTGLTP